MHRKLYKHFVPSRHNSYRPHILRKGPLTFFVMLIMVTEGMFMSGLYVTETPSIQNVQVAGVASAPSVLNSIGKELGRFAVDSEPFTPWILGAIGTLLAIALLFAFFIHIQIQQSEMLFSGALVALFAFSLMITNIHILGIV